MKLKLIIFLSSLLAFPSLAFACGSPQVEKLSIQLKSIFTSKKPSVADVEKHFLPLIDTEYMTKYVVGRYQWNQATQADINTLLTLYRRLLIAQYKKLLAINTRDQPKLVINTKLTQIEADRVILSGHLIRPKQGKAAISFFLHCSSSQTWQLYDIALDNLYLLEQLKLQFATVIRHGGIKALIEEIKKLNATSKS